MVVAAWYSESHGFHSPGREFFEMQEAVTDKNGNFIIKGWWLKFLPRFWASIPMNTPELLVYKYGYEPNKYWNQYPRDRIGGDTHGVFVNWNRTDALEVQPLVGTKRENFLRFYENKSKLELMYFCDLEKTKMLFLEVDKQVFEMEQNRSEMTSIANDINPWLISDYFFPEHCLEVVDFLRNSRNKINKK